MTKAERPDHRAPRRSPTLPSTPDRRKLLLAAAALPLAGRGLWQAGSAHAVGPIFEATLRDRLTQDGVGFATAQVSPAGVKLNALGVMRHGEAAPITAQSLFELGSITKAFTALLFADGVLKRRWRFDDPVESGLPDGLKLRDSNGEPLRLIDLATHRSGLPRMPTNLSAKELPNPYPSYTEERLFAFLREWKPTVGRGSRFEYSNLGYGLLAQVLARREGRSLDDVLTERVFQPLGLDDLRLGRPLPSGDDLIQVGKALSASLALAPRLATAHGADRKPTAAWQFDALAGAIGMLGSIDSVARFIQAALGLYDHSLQDAFAMCLQRRVEGEHPLHPFGLAWELSTMVGKNSQRTLFNQDGATGGFSTSLWLEPAMRRGAAVLANAFIETRSLALLALDPGIGADDFNLVYLPVEALAPLAGLYRLDAQYALELRVRQGRLWAQSGGRPEFELLPSAPRRFFARDIGLEVVFDDGPRPQRLTLLRDSGTPRTFVRQ